MTTSATGTTNLFPFLVAEEAHHDHQAEEALFLTFNVDLGYLEARLLGLLRACGSTVTVIADAGVWWPDPRAVRHAGRSYHVGLIDASRAFHSKLMVMVGPKRAIAAVGSGNLTMGGWQYNRELLTVFTGDGDGMPIAFADIRGALNSLAAGIPLDAVTTGAVARTIRQLDRLLERAPTVETGHRVHASWQGPLIESLPNEPVRDLFMSAAFHDPSGNAVRNLLRRLQPQRVEIAIQPGWTRLDPRNLDRVLTNYASNSGASVRLLEDPEAMGSKHSRYRHGKLVEWLTGAGERGALTGSPNLTTVALLKSTAEGGNYEMAVVGPVPETLFPGGEPVDLASVPTLTGTVGDTTSGEASGPTLRILAAVIVDDVLTIDLNRGVGRAVTIEVSHRSDHPDAWTPIGVIEEGSSAVFNLNLAGASRVRLVTDDGPSVAIFVSDAVRVSTRNIPEKRSSRTQRASSGDLFGSNFDLLNLLLGEFTEFAQDVANAKAPTQERDTGLERDDANGRHTGDAVEPWLWLQGDAVRRYGPSLAAWLLALPRIAESEPASVPWADIITDEDAVGLDSDEESAEIDESLATDEVKSHTRDLVDHAADAEALKRKRRLWAAKSAGVAEALSLASRMLILRVTLTFWTGGNWSDEDPEPFVLTRDLLNAINVDGQSAETAERAGALAAVAITVMRQHTDITVGNEKTLRFAETRQAAARLVQTASAEAIDAYVAGLQTVNGGALTSGHVTDTLADVLGDDPLADLEAAMESEGHEVHRPSPTSMHICITRGSVALVASEAVGTAQDHDRISVWASNDAGDWACVVWHKPDLITVFNHGRQERWRHQRLPDRLSPAAAAETLRRARLEGGGTAGLPAVINRPKHAKTAEAEAILAGLGIYVPNPPPCCSASVAAKPVA